MMAGINDMVWPAKSLHLNCIENAWGELVPRLHHGERQLESVDDMRGALFYERDKVDLTYIRGLISSMWNRAHERRISSY